MRLTLHIGPHKTGTTAIQSTFHAGRRRLLRHGVLYPKSNWHLQAQHRLAFALKNRHLNGTNDTPDRDVERAELLRALDRHRGDQAFLSSEEFFSAPPPAIAWLAEALQGHQVQILCFLRRPDNFLLSSYNQKARHPGNGFSETLEPFLAEPGKIAREIHYARHVSAWADVFSDAAMRLEIYEDGPPLQRALHHLGLPENTLSCKQHVNASAPAAVVELMRRAKAAGLCPKQQIKLLQRANHYFKGSPAADLSNQDRQNIIATFEAENGALFARFGRANPFTVANATFRNAPTDPPLSEDDLIHFIGTLL